MLQSGQVTLGREGAPYDRGNYYNPAPTPATFYTITVTQPGSVPVYAQLGNLASPGSASTVWVQFNAPNDDPEQQKLAQQLKGNYPRLVREPDMTPAGPMWDVSRSKLAGRFKAQDRISGMLRGEVYEHIRAFSDRQQHRLDALESGSRR